MDKVPIFLYDMDDKTCDLNFMNKSSMSKTNLYLIDNVTQSYVEVKIPKGQYSAYMIMHKNGQNHLMYGVDDMFINPLKNLKFIDEMMSRIINKGGNKIAPMQKNKSKVSRLANVSTI